jgi:hypothetical protein
MELIYFNDIFYLDMQSFFSSFLFNFCAGAIKFKSSLLIYYLFIFGFLFFTYYLFYLERFIKLNFFFNFILFIFVIFYI